MAEGGGALPHPRMDWTSPDRAQSFKEFRQIANMWFKVKKIKEEDQHNYIILWSGQVVRVLRCLIHGVSLMTN